MDYKLFAVVAIAFTVIAGMAFAAPGWYGDNFRMQGGTGNWTRNPSWNYAGYHNGARFANGANSTFKGPRGFGRGLNATFNSTAARDFQAAVESGDYATASSLHSQYGFGGPIFGKLNETTFAMYSSIASLTSQLRAELGLNSTGKGIARGFVFAGGMKVVRGAPMRGMHRHFLNDSTGEGQASAQSPPSPHAD